MFRKVIPGTVSRLTIVDHRETYGRHLLEKIVNNMDVSLCLDLGCGTGDDLMTVKQAHPKCKCIGVDFGSWNRELLIDKGIEPVAINIEYQALPFKNDSVDLIIANQIIEHTKEVFWINHEIFRTLRVGGYLYLGVPNVLSLHNRILGFFGIHPTASKMISAHVRAFSKNDTLLFYKEIAGGFAVVESFLGSQFYPFPKMFARPLATIFPSLSFSIFFLIRKTAEYKGEFTAWLSHAPLETNFFVGQDT